MQALLCGHEIWLSPILARTGRLHERRKSKPAPSCFKGTNSCTLPQHILQKSHVHSVAPFMRNSGVTRSCMGQRGCMPGQLRHSFQGQRTAQAVKSPAIKTSSPPQDAFQWNFAEGATSRWLLNMPCGSLQSSLATSPVAMPCLALRLCSVASARLQQSSSMTGCSPLVNQVAILLCLQLWGRGQRDSGCYLAIASDGLYR